MALDPRFWSYYVPVCAAPRWQYPNYPNALWEKYDRHNTPVYLQPYNPTLGRYGTADVSLKGYLKNDSCQYGYYAADLGGQGACCNVYGECGIGNKRLT